MRAPMRWAELTLIPLAAAIIAQSSGLPREEICSGSRDDALGHLGPERRDARGPHLVAKQTVHALFGKSMLPAPDAGLRLASPLNDVVDSDPRGGEQKDSGLPGELPGGAVIVNQPLQAAMI